MNKTAEALYKKSLNTLEFNKILSQLSDYCLTDEAKTMAQNLMPSNDLETVKREVRRSDEAKIMIQRRGTPPIGTISEVNSSVKRAKVGSALSIPELIKIGSLLTTARKLVDYFDAFSEEDRILSRNYSKLEAVSPLEKRISESILSPEELSDNASPELFDIRRKISRLNAKTRDILQDIIHSQRYQKCLQEPIITVRNDRYVVPVKAEYRGELGGLVHDMSSTGSTLFVEPMAVVETNNKIKMLYAEEKEEIERILYSISADVAEAADIIERDYYHIVRLDFAFAKAKLAIKHDAQAPMITDETKINLRRAKHPLLDKKTAVPIDIELGERFDTLVITGPNTGGKTVALKTLGLLCAMTLSGLLIPVGDNSVVGIYDYIYSDIGDEQSIEQSLSTFSAHMKTIVSIIENCVGRTMVLFDEIGAGTDPVEGAVLAISILEYTKSLGAQIAATTHYSELKIYALSTENVENASCEFNVETLRPTYKLLIGVPGRSNAFAISKRLGLSDNIIEDAKKRMSQESLKFEDVIRDLEKNRTEMEQEREHTRQLMIEIEALKRTAEVTEKAQKRERERLIRQAREEAQSIINRARDASDKVMSELEELKRKNEREVAQMKLMENRAALRGVLKSAQKNIDSRETEAEEIKGNITKPLKAGDVVKIIKLNREATVVADQDGDKVLLQAGIMRVTVPVGELEFVEQNRQNKRKAQATVKKNINVAKRNVKTELDVRGMTVEEAIYDIDKFIDDAVLLNIKKIQIIHGKGTGALRSGVHAHLRTHRAIAGFRLGMYGEGENGVTIAELK